METYAVPLAALIVAVGTLLYAVLAARGKADGSYVEQLKERVERLEEALRICEERREVLERENLRLLRALVDKPSAI